MQSFIPTGRYWQSGIYLEFYNMESIKGHLSDSFKPLTSQCYRGKRYCRRNNFTFMVILEQPPQRFELGAKTSWRPKSSFIMINCCCQMKIQCFPNLKNLSKTDFLLDNHVILQLQWIEKISCLTNTIKDRWIFWSQVKKKTKKKQNCHFMQQQKYSSIIFIALVVPL